MAHIIRKVSIKDVESFIAMLTKIYDDSLYMFYTPGEYDPSVTSASKQLEEYITSPSKVIYVAESDNQLVGFAFVNTQPFQRIKHIAKINLGVKMLYQRQGIGQALMDEIMAWSLNNNIHRIEATVPIDNQSALDLFKSSDFQIEGVLQDTLFINGKYFNEYMMAKIV
ncbi:GNAT family N-acetyltransferase [Staphylococcus simiae]|uniref:GNAT family N-acetyltransferase n=1 Tax=Staphylococcus simiae TaxID=308354 RepID=UPI001A970376|nr:GNAT family N-acetyltransferase [Staphylococcus simiae]MBO1198833.1 GNAT family N-acetyltransferase [Staphylococcus simiae]MBO1201030.1 GNAT family N-acetyltransferase [Staphylococcus simiae]MBO1203846.1 GNAT family N-acetyltransferase [Staphylococcus simiae]MBO1211070.1 GNAT family N-acetyltransferase [Staphylococcus simiae]MBO1229377.1 GNAT family N-acetyltransferase [Staphylococcus simiae]